MSADIDRRVLSYGDTVLHESDLQTLKKDTWLNDRILTFAIEYLYDTMLNETEKQKVCIVQAAVCQMFKFVDWKGAMSLCENLSLADKEHIIFVMNNHWDPTSPGGSHWSILFYRSGDMRFYLVDSLSNPSLDAAQQMLKTITKCLGLRSAELIVADSAKQRNGSDCGVYAIEFVRIYLKNLHDPSAIDFTQVSAKEVAIQRDCWLTIIHNLVNEENITDCAFTCHHSIMLTPVFSIKQDDHFLIIDIRAPYANVKDTEIEYDGRMFLFSSSPYFLRLHLTADVVQSDDGSAEYDSDKGNFVVKVPKKTKGEHFKNLDMITELLRPQKQPTADHLVEEIDDADADDGDEYFVDQKESKEEEEPLDEVCTVFGYGFGWRRHGVFGRLATEIDNLIDLEDAENSKIDERGDACCAHDQLSFQPDHYIADLMDENEHLKGCLNFELVMSSFEISNDDREHLKELPRRKLPKLNDECARQVALSLIDILFAYLYDLRTNDGEHCVESGWTIAKLSPSLSFLVRWRSAKEALVSAVRRSLCYPLYRHWNISMRIIDDLKLLLVKGRSVILHCLTDIRRVFSTSGDFRYLLNELYMTDYCIWIQCIDDELIEWLKNEVSKVELQKNDVKLELEEIELEAKLMALDVADNAEPLDSDDES